MFTMRVCKKIRKIKPLRRVALKMNTLLYYVQIAWEIYTWIFTKAIMIIALLPRCICYKMSIIISKFNGIIGTAVFGCDAFNIQVFIFLFILPCCPIHVYHNYFHKTFARKPTVLTVGGIAACSLLFLSMQLIMIFASLIAAVFYNLFLQIS